MELTNIMKQHTCELCHTIFNRKEHLIHHTNKLRKCNIATEFECEWCSRAFTTNFGLIRHLTTCKVKCKQDDIERKIQEEIQLTNKRIEELEAKCKRTEPITIQNTLHVLAEYGHEDLSHITLERITFVFSKSFSSVVECVKLIHFSPLAPQNKNICIKELNSRFAYVFCDGNWDAIGRKKLINILYYDICEYIEEKLDDLIDELDKTVVINIKRFLDKKYDEKETNIIKTELGVLLFNKRDSA